VTWWRSLCVLLCVLTTLAFPKSASASSGLQAENRVKGFLLVAPTLVGGSSGRSLEKHLGKSIAYDETASGSCLAAEAGGSDTFEIIDGVRRAKAADLAGQDTIRATVMQGDVATGEVDVPISQLLSPKEAIDVSSSPAQFGRWQSIMEGTQQGARLPNIQITPGTSGTPISGVGFE
jgi:hypothetical protein